MAKQATRYGQPLVHMVAQIPAPYLSGTQREQLCNLGKKICQHVNYECAGTVEFLMDMDSGEFYFIEVNPRVQVEHTVTEEVTGIDIVRAQILIAEGKTIAEATGKATQADVRLDGHALQTRITTEDPQNNFIPDYGRITAFRDMGAPVLAITSRRAETLKATAYDGDLARILLPPKAGQ